MSIKITGKDLSIDKLYQVSFENAKVLLDKDSVSKIIKCRKMVEDKIDQGEIMYGINTGIGEFSETILDPKKLENQPLGIKGSKIGFPKNRIGTANSKNLKNLHFRPY